MDLIDVHAHICSEDFDADRAVVLQKAQEAGVTTILDSGESITENDKVLLLSEQFPILKPCAGFSPKNLKQADAKLVQDHIRANANKFIAIGEVGLDYWCVKEHADREKQKQIFASFVELAKELDKPLIVHSRSAGKYAIEILKKHNASQVCMHAFDGSAENARIGADLGYFFSIPPSIVRSEQKQKMVLVLPLDNILLESDAPSLSPVIDKRNVPANVLVSLKEVAKIKGLTKAEIAKKTIENAKKLFKI